VKAVFADTFYWIALTNPADSHFDFTQQKKCWRKYWRFCR